jgi:hypothetical protein
MKTGAIADETLIHFFGLCCEFATDSRVRNFSVDHALRTAARKTGADGWLGLSVRTREVFKKVFNMGGPKEAARNKDASDARRVMTSGGVGSDQFHTVAEVQPLPAASNAPRPENDGEHINEDGRGLPLAATLCARDGALTTCLFSGHREKRSRLCPSRYRRGDQACLVGSDPMTRASRRPTSTRSWNRSHEVRWRWRAPPSCSC